MLEARCCTFLLKYKLNSLLRQEDYRTWKPVHSVMATTHSLSHKTYYYGTEKEKVRIAPCLFVYKFHLCSGECVWSLAFLNAAVWSGDVAPVSGSSHFTNPESLTPLQGNSHWNKKLQLAVAFPFSPSGLSDINFSWLTVNQIALWAQFSFWFLAPELLIQNIKIRFPSELRSCIYNDKKFSLTETLSCDSVMQMRKKTVHTS